MLGRRGARFNSDEHGLRGGARDLLHDRELARRQLLLRLGPLRLGLREGEARAAVVVDVLLVDRVAAAGPVVPVRGPEDLAVVVAGLLVLPDEDAVERAAALRTARARAAAHVDALPDVL